MCPRDYMAIMHVEPSNLLTKYSITFYFLLFDNVAKLYENLSVCFLFLNMYS